MLFDEIYRTPLESINSFLEYRCLFFSLFLHILACVIWQFAYSFQNIVRIVENGRFSFGVSVSAWCKSDKIAAGDSIDKITECVVRPR